METPPSTERTGPQKGDVIDGSLEIEAILAEGSTSTVVSATDRETRSKLAIKIARGSDLESLERFRRAARAMTRLKSPFTVKVLAVGETQDGLPCMSMEYLEGKTLALTLLQRGPLPVDDAIRWIKQAAESVAEAHAKSFLHRDLDAENLFLAVPPRGLVGPPSIRVLDYGLSPVWRTNKADGRLKPGEVPGTSFALAPELVRGADLDERVDIWGLGNCLYRLLTNRYPFSARNLAELCTKLLAEHAPDVSKLRPDVTPALAAVVKRCLEREADDRFPSVKALIVALDEAQDASPNTPQVPTERALLEDLRETPMTMEAAPPSGDDPTGIFAHAPKTVRIAPDPDTADGPTHRPTPRVPPEPDTADRLTPRAPPEPDTADGPSTQPLGRLSPFAELPKPVPVAAPESMEITPSSSELSIAPQLFPASDKADKAPSPKPALPRVSPAMAAQETMPGGSGPPPPQLVFEAPPRTLAMPSPVLTGPPPPPPPPPLRPEPSYPAPIVDDVQFATEEAPKRRRGGIIMLFVLGIAGSIAVGLYAAKASVGPKPAVPVVLPSASVTPAASESFATPESSDSADAVTSAAPTTSAITSGSTSAEPPETTPTTVATVATHRRAPRPPPSAAAVTAPPSATKSVYDPGP